MDLTSPHVSIVDTSAYMPGAYVGPPAQPLDLPDLPRQANAVDTKSESRVLAAVLDLVAKLQCCTSLHNACLMAAANVQSYLKAQSVAIGLSSGRGRPCKLQSLSGVAGFDKDSEMVRSIEAALDESLIRNCLTIWPPSSDSNRHSTLAHQKLCLQAGCAAIVSSPLRDEQGTAVGASLVLLPAPASSDALRFVRACETTIGSCMHLWTRAERSSISRLTHAMLEGRKSWQVWTALAGACAAAAILSAPMHYRITCDCKTEPVTRRLIAAPFDARLETVLAAPGDVVAAGQVLARLDGREIRWELAGITADYNRAGKQTDASLAVHHVAAAQQAKLERDRLELKIRLLRERAEQLDIKSPLSGIVVAGDLRKAEGAPLATGQTLFEVAPLDQMLVELSVPEADVGHVVARAGVTVWLDAYPGLRWSGTIGRIHPRSEIRNDRNVFIAEVAFDNPNNKLRPGMNGSARIVGPRRTLGWNLLHKPWAKVREMAGW